MYKLLLLFFSIGLLSCQNGEKKSASQWKSYKSTTEVIDVPKDLKEISGISFVNDSIVAAIEDENGVLYFFDLNKKKIIREFSFAEEGDYEDLARKDNIMYVVRADGIIYQLVDFAGEHPQITYYKTPLKSENDIEGLAYDAKNDRLLLSVKGKNLSKADDEEEVKNIYQFTLKDMKFHEEPVFRIFLKDIEDQFRGDALMQASKHFLKAVGNNNLNKVIKPSALTYNPINGKLYVLSAINSFILVLNEDGSFDKIIRFGGSEFIQPEGIAFNSKGELFISNEGKKKKGNIVKITQ